MKFRGICEACPNECLGFGWFDPNIKHWSDLRIMRKARFHYCCSVECADVIQRRKGDMQDPTPHEINAMTDASIAGGDYMQGIGKTSLDELTSDEWMCFVEAICTGFCDGMRHRAGMVMLNMNLSQDGIG